MLDREWKQYFKFGVEVGGLFNAAVADMLLEIQTASPKDRPAYAASFGGFVRGCQTHVRIVLARAMIRELHITPTQHVASFVMRSVFGRAASTATLDQHFAVPSRDASVKYMDAARLILARRDVQAIRYARLYEWYCGELKRRIMLLRVRQTNTDQ